MKKIRNFFIIIIALGYIVFEKMFWVKIAKPLINYLKEKDFYHSVENKILQCNRYLILLCFILFFALSEFMGIYALALFSKGMIILGILFYLIKTIPVIIAFSILDKAKDKLYTFIWFKVTHIFVSTKIDSLKRTRMYRKITFLYKVFVQSVSERETLFSRYIRSKR